MVYAGIGIGVLFCTSVGVSGQEPANAGAARGDAKAGAVTGGVVAVGEIGQRLAHLVGLAEVVGFSGTVLAARDGEVLVATAVGAADAEGAAITPDTLFEIASATKQFTAAAVLRLVQDGRLGLDDPIARHLPGVPESCGEITVRHLLQHTSGIPGTNSTGAGDELARVLPFFLRGGPMHPPGTHWEYWNQGYALASEVIARASGTSFTEYCKTALFARAGLTSTRFTGDLAPEGAVVALGQSERGARTALEHPYGAYGFQYRGMGGAVTSVWDLWRWDRALRQDTVMGEAARKELFAPGLNDYALGWFVRRDAAGRLVQSHGGGVRGFLCDIRRYPEQDACLFVLANDDVAPLHSLVTLLEETLFEQASSFAPLPRPIPSDLASALDGTYAVPSGTRMVVSRRGFCTGVAISWGSGNEGVGTRATLGLDSEGELILYEWRTATKVKVTRNEAKAIVKLEVAGMPFERR